MISKNNALENRGTYVAVRVLVVQVVAIAYLVTVLVGVGAVMVTMDRVVAPSYTVTGRGVEVDVTSVPAGGGQGISTPLLISTIVRGDLTGHVQGGSSAHRRASLSDVLGRVDFRHNQRLRVNRALVDLVNLDQVLLSLLKECSLVLQYVSPDAAELGLGDIRLHRCGGDDGRCDSSCRISGGLSPRQLARSSHDIDDLLDGHSRPGQLQCR